MKPCSRRQMLQRTSLAIAGSSLPLRLPGAEVPGGSIIGEPTAARVGSEILKTGGTALDAIVAGALAAAVASPHNCGIGGYGGHMVFFLRNRRNPVCLDFNTVAPIAAKPEMFGSGAGGQAARPSNEYGWLAAGVPGTVAGLEYATKFCTRKFRELLQPAIELAEEGFKAGRLSMVIRNSAAGLKKDPASTALYFPNGQPPEPETIFRNPDLARLLRKMASDNSSETFYRGDAAKQMAEAFRAGGGILTKNDLKEYAVDDVKTLETTHGSFTIHTAPLTAGGTTSIHALNILRTLNWESLPDELQKSQARIEAMRLAWADRLRFFGDPKYVPDGSFRAVRHDQLAACAEIISEALRMRRPVDASPLPLPEDHGTVHLSCADAMGNLAAVTLTHGNSFGAQVTVPGLGLTLGHGMSRFVPRPGHPNSIRPRKRPLHNMCPTLVMRGRQPLLAVGGAGGRKIPNAVFDVLLNYLQSGGSLGRSIAAPRAHTEGDLRLALEEQWPAGVVEYLKSIGYKITRAGSALVSAASFNPETGKTEGLSR